MTDLESSIYQDSESRESESRKNPIRKFPLVVGTKVQAPDGDTGEIVKIDKEEKNHPYSIKWNKAKYVTDGYTEDEIFRRFQVVIEEELDEDIDESPLNIIIVEGK